MKDTAALQVTTHHCLLRPHSDPLNTLWLLNWSVANPKVFVGHYIVALTRMLVGSVKLPWNIVQRTLAMGCKKADVLRMIVVVVLNIHSPHHSIINSNIRVELL